MKIQVRGLVPILLLDKMLGIFFLNSCEQAATGYSFKIFVIWCVQEICLYLILTFREDLNRGFSGANGI